MRATHGGFGDLFRTRATGDHPDLFRSVALALNMIGKRPEKHGILDKQAAAACGQPPVMNPIVRCE